MHEYMGLLSKNSMIMQKTHAVNGMGLGVFFSKGGGSMRVYLDNCCYNRPFDPQEQLRVAIETEAKMRVQDLMRTGQIEYVWSAVLDYEVGKSRFQDRVDMIWPWGDKATVFVPMY